MRPLRWKFCLQAIACLLFSGAGDVPPLLAQDLHWGGSLRGYQFVRTEANPLEKRRDTELWILRLTLETAFNPRIKAESHGVLTLQSPPRTGASRLATSPARTYLSLERDLIDASGVSLQGSFDRANLQIHYDTVRIVLGRQAISWGVTNFWPSMDLFSPFAPQQVDRDYKAGVDAVRVTIPLGAFSELEWIGAVLGSSLSRDGAAGALARINLGPVDLGLMGGTFHRDTVAGGFFTANVMGTGLRGELTWTRSGDPEDLERDRKTFSRGSLAFDRQLTRDLSLTVESSWNGYGADDASEYILFIEADRIQRGEVNALGQWYAGVSVVWQLHPLWTFTNVLLVNWQDPSSLWVPSLQWSTSDNSEVLFGAQVGLAGNCKPGASQGASMARLPIPSIRRSRRIFEEQMPLLSGG